MKNSYKYFINKDCKYYPCHSFDNINCLFCFCPEYQYNCEGKFKILENGHKDCFKCNIPHGKNGYNRIIKFLKKQKPFVLS